MKRVIPVTWIREMESGEIKPMIKFQNLEWKFIRREEYAYHEWGTDYYYCEFELNEDKEHDK